MFNSIGTGELILILAIALIVVGPAKLPELGKTLGKTASEFKKFSNEIKGDLSLDETTKKVENKAKEDKVSENKASEDKAKEDKVKEDQAIQ